MTEELSRQQGIRIAYLALALLKLAYLCGVDQSLLLIIEIVIYLALVYLSGENECVR